MIYLTSLKIREAGWSSQVARKAHNLEVGRSNRPPARPLMKHYIAISLILFFLASNSYGEIRGSIWRGDRERKVVALTFDDGPKPEFSNKILDILDRYGVRATFFVVGEEAKMHGDIVFRMDDSGHEVGNHSHTSQSGRVLSEKEFIEQIRMTNDVIYEILKKHPKYFRPPGGWYNAAVHREINNMGMKIVNWTINANDYVEEREEFDVGEDWDRQAKELVMRILSGVEGGSIILFHNGSPQTVRALPSIIEGLKEKGFGFVTISELISK